VALLHYPARAEVALLHYPARAEVAFLHYPASNVGFRAAQKKYSSLFFFSCSRNFLTLRYGLKKERKTTTLIRPRFEPSNPNTGHQPVAYFLFLILHRIRQ
jgi:hypothetical protein